MNNRPKQLEKLRKEHYDKLYSRQPQLMERLIPFMRKAEIIENPLSKTEPSNIKPDKKKILRKNINRFQDKVKRKKTKIKDSNKKISEIKPSILWGLR